MNALYRPGPMQFIPNYIDRKHGKEKVSYPHPLLEGILKNTYGIMVYQEQIMQLALQLAGYSLGEADLLRRAMGKKVPEEMAKHPEPEGHHGDESAVMFVIVEEWESVDKRMDFSMNRDKSRERELFPHLEPAHTHEFYTDVTP